VENHISQILRLLFGLRLADGVASGKQTKTNKQLWESNPNNYGNRTLKIKLFVCFRMLRSIAVRVAIG
jgi:hypothetical protein